MSSRTKERNVKFASLFRSHYIEKYSWLPLLIIIATQRKADTITTNALFSFNGRKLVTSLILVITSLILLALLIVNLDFIKFTEASVNTTTALASNNTISTTSTPAASPSLNPALILSQPQFVNNSNININNSISVTTQQQAEVDLNINNNITSGPVVLAKGKVDTNNITGGDGGVIATNATTQRFTNASQMAANSTEVKSSSNPEKTSSEESVPQENSPCPTSSPDRYNSTHSSNDTNRYFDIDHASRTFEESMSDKNAISLHHYLNGFKELMKFFHSLGTIFLFVTSDLETKIGLLEGYRNTEKGGCNPAYLTIQSAIEYETKENLLRDPKRQSGARTILRLHRALEFLSSLMLNLSRLSDDAETAPAAREAYSNTLAKHHPWTIRTIASFAMRTLPHKKTLVESVLGKENIVNETITNEKMLTLANVTENLFNVVDKYYEEHDIKDLP